MSVAYKFRITQTTAHTFSCKTWKLVLVGYVFNQEISLKDKILPF